MQSQQNIGGVSQANSAWMSASSAGLGVHTLDRTGRRFWRLAGRDGAEVLPGPLALRQALTQAGPEVEAVHASDACVAQAPPAHLSTRQAARGRRRGILHSILAEPCL